MDAHPIHLHLVQFQLVSRRDLDTTNYTNDWLALNGMPPLNHSTKVLPVDSYLQLGPFPPALNEQGWKDTIQVYPDQVTTIRVRFAPQNANPTLLYPGNNLYPFDPTEGPGYVWHCHILDHEENEMMRPYKVINPITFTLTNTASVTSDTPEPFYNPHPNTVIVTSSGDSDVILTVNKMVMSPHPLYAGNQLTYHIVVTNTSTKDAKDVVLTDTLSTFVSAAPPPTSSAPSVYTWNIGTLAGSATYAVHIVVNTLDDATGIINSGQVQWKTTGQTQTANFSLTTPLTAQADLGITKVLVSPCEPVHPGDTLHYLITVHNYGPSMAKNVVVTDTLPTNVTYLSADISPTTLPPPPSLDYTWNLGNIHAGSHGSINLYVIVNE